MYDDDSAEVQIVYWCLPHTQMNKQAILLLKSKAKFPKPPALNKYILDYSELFKSKLRYSTVGTSS